MDLKYISVVVPFHGFLLYLIVIFNEGIITVYTKRNHTTIQSQVQDQTKMDKKVGGGVVCCHRYCYTFIFDWNFSRPFATVEVNMLKRYSVDHFSIKCIEPLLIWFNDSSFAFCLNGLFDDM